MDRNIGDAYKYRIIKIIKHIIFYVIYKLSYYKNNRIIMKFMTIIE